MEKLKVGQKVWVITRNRMREDEPIEDEITKVGNKYFNLKNNRSKFYLGSLTEATEYTPTYTVYINKQDLLDKRELSRLSDEIRAMLGQWGNLPLPLEKVRNIYEIIKS